MIYRGQAYGAPVGAWWTSSLRKAEKFAMSRGGNRTYVVLSLSEDDVDWLAEFLYAERAGDEAGTWYHIPVDRLRERWRGVRIHGGAISMEGSMTTEPADPAAINPVAPVAAGKK